MYLLPFCHPEHPPTDGTGWKFFITCKDSDGEVSDFLDAVDAVGGEFEDAWRHFSKLALTGQPWKKLIPEAKRLHDVGKVKCKRSNGKHETHTVWSFKHGRVRILWCYAGPNKVILFGQTLFKDQNQIPEADIAAVGKEMQSYVTAADAGTLKIAGGKENEQAFGPFFGIEPEPSRLQQKNSPGRNRR